MKKISGALARLAGVHGDPVRDEPDGPQPLDESLDPEFPTREEQEEQETVLDELDALVAELEQEAERG